LTVGIELVGNLGLPFGLLSSRCACIRFQAAAYDPWVPHSSHILIGPFSPFGLIKDTEMLKNNFSDIAIVLLLFGLGLSFPLKQLGEFSLIVLKTGQDLEVISSMLFPIIGMAVALTTFIGPMLVKVGSRIVVVYE
jgi:predicted Kef-type K+ transport protein